MPDERGAAHWRERAEEARAIADRMREPNAKKALEGIAESYEHLAEMAERAERRQRQET